MGAASRRRAPQQERSRKKVESILAAARSLLETEGPEALNTNRIASEAGMGVGSLYEYFPNKEAIASALIEQLSAEEAETVMARFDASAGLALAPGIAELVEVVFALYQQNHRLFDALWSMRRVARTIGHRPGEQMILEAIHARLAAHQDELDVSDLELACFTCFHLVESLAKQMVAQRGRRWSAKRCTAEITRAVLRYLGLRDA